MNHMNDNGRDMPKARILVIRAGKVYDVTEFADRHPGGRELLQKHNGRDVETVMQSSASHAHSNRAYSIMEKYFVGTVNSFLQVSCEVLIVFLTCVEVQ